MMIWPDSHRTLYNHSCHSMYELADDSIQCCVTSPPYHGLRKYKGNQDLIWDGDKDCLHTWIDTSYVRNNDKTAGKIQRGNKGSVGRDNPIDNAFCSLCGAWRGPFGLEPTVEMYVAHSVEVLREIRRVLRKDGVVFWNCGDSYYSSPSNQQGKGVKGSGVGVRGCQEVGRVKLPRHDTLKPKDLCLIPFRVAIAAQEDGWYIRSVIIWSKPNPMPESVRSSHFIRHYVTIEEYESLQGVWTTQNSASLSELQCHEKGQVNPTLVECPGCPKCKDGYIHVKGSWRPTESHEYVLMLTKSEDYYTDMEAVREPHLPETIKRYKYGYRESSRDKEHQGHHGEGYQRNDGSPIELNGGRNLRSVWTFSTTPFKGSHFATFPEKLPELCIKAATPEEGCCGKCGMPWERIVEKEKPPADVFTKKHTPDEAFSGSFIEGEMRGQGQKLQNWLNEHPAKTLGWQPACKCNADKVPSIVLDPFCGSGTVLEVAAKLGRKAVGYEISEEYCNLIIERNRQGVLHDV